MQKIHLANKPKLVITEEVYDQITFLCRNIPNKEWSGILLYSVEGSIRDIDNLTMTAEYIIPMDVGTATSTGFKFNETKRTISKDPHIEFCTKHPEALKWKIGLIHSHQGFSTFFSDTDEEELFDNSEFFNYYLSLIVNNKYEPIAKIGFRGQSEQEVKIYCLDETGEKYEMAVEGISTKIETYYTCDCDIITETKELDSWFLDQYEKILPKKKVKTTKPVVKTKNTLPLITLPFNDADWDEEEDDEENFLIDWLFESSSMNVMPASLDAAINKCVYSSLSVSSFKYNLESSYYDIFYSYFTNTTEEEHDKILDSLIKRLSFYEHSYPIVSTIISVLEDKKYFITTNNKKR